MQEVIENYRKETHERICETDTLIIDEISMLSQTQFKLVEKACAAKTLIIDEISMFSPKQFELVKKPVQPKN